jgi:hypothetical protein
MPRLAFSLTAQMSCSMLQHMSISHSASI